MIFLKIRKQERRSARAQICITPDLLEYAKDRAAELRTTFSDYINNLILDDKEEKESKEKRK